MASAEQIRRAMEAEAAPVKKPNGIPKPRGRAPLGATWDYDKGEWVGGTKPSKPKPKTPKSPKPAGAKKPAAKPAKNANDKFPKPRARRVLA